MKDSVFYNQESGQYSDKRYPRAARSYVQFFFKRRLALTLSFLGEAIATQKSDLSLLEVGCADGVVIRAIENKFPHKFKKIVGIDIATEMIEQAKKKNSSPHVEFFTRDAYTSTEQVDVVVETGVINYVRMEQELEFAHEHLSPQGLFILSIAGTGSLLNKLKHEEGFSDFRSYTEYDRLVREKFVVLSVRGCGVFVPYLWRIPALARPLQALLDTIVGFVAPGLCHEKVYLLQKK
jgi:SAM-dependent methyltransferase